MIKTSTARRVLQDLYGIDADLTELHGEFDDNFLAVAADGDKRIFKIMNADCQEQRVDMQCAAMTHLADKAAGLNLPSVTPTTSGRSHTVANVDGVERLVWLLRYCEGTLLEDIALRSDELIRSFGRTMGLLDAGLRSFTHPAMRPGHEWELTRAGDAQSYLQHVAPDVSGLVDKVLRHFESDVLPGLAGLPHSVIHNDANDGNVLVSVVDDQAAVVNGLIDFGDMTYQPTICDVAIALAYVVIGENDPLSSCARFLEGYSEISPLTGDELAVLHDLIMARLAVSISISAGRRSKDVNDPIGRQDKRPAMLALARLADISPRLAECAYRHTRISS